MRLVADDNPYTKLVVDGVVYDANTDVPLPVSEFVPTAAEALIWALNTELRRRGPSPRRRRCDSKDDSSCYLKVLSQWLQTSSVSKVISPVKSVLAISGRGQPFGPIHFVGGFE